MTPTPLEKNRRRNPTPSDPNGILIVANRLPVHRVRSGSRVHWAASPGGLVSAMTPVLDEAGGSWVGWSGSAGPAPKSFEYGGIHIRPVGLTQAEASGYYLGFSNSTIWPLYHDAIRPPRFEQDWWKPYVEVNEKFAITAAREALPGQSIWIHDYHLQLVPKMLRALRKDLQIGFFLHIPFPPDELFAWLPWRREIVEGLLGADVIGFQTPASARAFATAARRFTSAVGNPPSLRFQNRSIRVDDFPISVDFERFENEAQQPQVLKRAAQIREEIGPERKIFLSVDRLDYTKGIDSRLLAFEALLRSKEVSVRDFVFMQVAVPTRESVAEYADIRTQIEQLVGRVNGEYGIPGRVAVHYFRRSISPKELLALYRAADVMVVTPLCDGMNLVCKEYIATRSDWSGVLVLSEFAGAARELRRALIVNPRDVEGTKNALLEAVTMPRKEIYDRMSSMRRHVRNNNVFDWSARFLRALNG